MKYFQNLPGELNRSLSGSLNSPGELETLHDDQEAGVDVQHQVPGLKYFQNGNIFGNKIFSVSRPSPLPWPTRACRVDWSTPG